jgi:hypothetical protein
MSYGGSVPPGIHSAEEFQKVRDEGMHFQMLNEIRQKNLDFDLAHEMVKELGNWRSYALLKKIIYTHKINLKCMKWLRDEHKHLF